MSKLNNQDFDVAVTELKKEIQAAVLKETGFVWKDAGCAPKDGRPLLLFGRSNREGERTGPIVGHWDRTEGKWRSHPSDNGADLMVSHWMELPSEPAP